MSELRHDPLSRRWVTIAMERSRRPSEFLFPAPIPDHDHEPCDFCRGQETRTPPELYAVRDRGSANSGDWVVRVIPNKRPVFAIEGSIDRRAIGLYDRMRGIGAHEIVVETPVHQAKPAEMPLLQLSAALTASRIRISDLMRDTRFKYVLLFKNYGESAGATVFHPIQQIVATPVTPLLVSTQLSAARDYFQLKERCLFCDVIDQELDRGTRIVHVDDDFVSFTPYASRFPYEIHLYPRHHNHQFASLADSGTERLSAHMLAVFRRLDVVLGDAPLNWLLVNGPNTNVDVRRAGFWTTLEHDFHWHIEILPRLTPMAGFEWGTGLFINPTPPEDAAAFLRDAL